MNRYVEHRGWRVTGAKCEVRGHPARDHPHRVFASDLIPASLSEPLNLESRMLMLHDVTDARRCMWSFCMSFNAALGDGMSIVAIFMKCLLRTSLGHEEPFAVLEPLEGLGS